MVGVDYLNPSGTFLFVCFYFLIVFFLFFFFFFFFSSRRRHTRFDCDWSSDVCSSDLLGYLDFLSLYSGARIVLTDSGGIQEETTALGVPCLTLRENTERPITIEEGTNELVGTDRHAIVAAARRVLAGGGKRGRRPELWDGRAAERIVQHLREYFAAHLAKAA